MYICGANLAGNWNYLSSNGLGLRQKYERKVKINKQLVAK